MCLPTIPPDLIPRLHSASRVAVLTGAGVSAESGVPEPLFPFSPAAVEFRRYLENSQGGGPTARFSQ
jgi:hypothetical protein